MRPIPIETARAAIDLIARKGALHLTSAERLATSYGHPVETIQSLIDQAGGGE